MKGAVQLAMYEIRDGMQRRGASSASAAAKGIESNGGAVVAGDVLATDRLASVGATRASSARVQELERELVSEWERHAVQIPELERKHREEQRKRDVRYT